MTVWVDDRKTELLPPLKALASVGTKNVRALLRNKQPQIFMSDSDLCEIDPHGYVLIDFGRELSGGLRILFGAIETERGQIRFRLGESVGEAMAELGEKGACTDHSVRDSVLPACMNAELDTPSSGFRFARLDNTGDTKIGIAAVYARFTYTDVDEVGTFTCGDACIDSIFETARYTAKLCMQNGVLWDGIKRDRVVWAGDLHPLMLSCLYSFSATESVKNSLNFLRVTTPENEWMNKIPAYSMWWVICLFDYYFFSGDRAFLAANAEYAEYILSMLNESMTEDGSFDFRRTELSMWEDNEFFLDWPTARSPSSECGVRALMRFGAGKAKRLLRLAGRDSSVADRFLSKLALKQTAYNGEKQIAAMRVLAGEQSASSAYPILSRGSAKGVSCFMSYYILRAVAESGEAATALAIMREYFGGMLSRGATTFFEDFDVGWLSGSGRIDEPGKDGQKDLHGDFGAHCYKGFRHSLCHGWASGALPFLTEYILGFRPESPGCERVVLKPLPCGLETISGKLATPLGALSVSINKQNIDYDAPPGMTVRIEQ